MEALEGEEEDEPQLDAESRLIADIYCIDHDIRYIELVCAEYGLCAWRIRRVIRRMEAAVKKKEEE